MTNEHNFLIKLEWQSQAKCFGVGHEFFYPKAKTTRREGARLDEVESDRARFCLGLDDGVICPVKKECLEHALANREEGVWGGMTEDERNQLRRSREARRRKSA